MTIMELNPIAGTSDLVQGLSNVAYGGRLSLTFPAGTMTTSSTFKLFSADHYSGKFSALIPSTPGLGLTWNTNTLAIDGTLRVSALVSTNPVTISSALTGNVITLSWPADHIGWRLQVQTNASMMGLGSDWQDLSFSIATNVVSFPLDRAMGSVFYRLLLP